MYQISRCLYRELVRDIEDGRHRREVLVACETVVHRLIEDRFYFRRASRTLFREVRWYFPLAAQPRIHRIIERHVTFLLERCDDAESFERLTGYAPTCRAWTREGQPCEWTPKHGGYCGVHQNLIEDGLPSAA